MLRFIFFILFVFVSISANAQISGISGIFGGYRFPNADSINAVDPLGFQGRLAYDDATGDVYRWFSGDWLKLGNSLWQKYGSSDSIYYSGPVSVNDTLFYRALTVKALTPSYNNVAARFMGRTTYSGFIEFSGTNGDSSTIGQNVLNLDYKANSGYNFFNTTGKRNTLFFNDYVTGSGAYGELNGLSLTLNNGTTTNVLLNRDGDSYIINDLGIGETSPGAEIHIKDNTPYLYIQDGNAVNDYATVSLAATAGDFKLETRDNTGAYKWTSYQINNDTWGLESHLWRVGDDIQAMSLDTTGLNLETALNVYNHEQDKFNAYLGRKNLANVGAGDTIYIGYINYPDATAFTNALEVTISSYWGNMVIQYADYSTTGIFDDAYIKSYQSRFGDDRMLSLQPIFSLVGNNLHIALTNTEPTDISYVTIVTLRDIKSNYTATLIVKPQSNIPAGLTWTTPEQHSLIGRYEQFTYVGNETVTIDSDFRRVGINEPNPAYSIESKAPDSYLASLENTLGSVAYLRFNHVSNTPSHLGSNGSHLSLFPNSGITYIQSSGLNNKLYAIDYTGTPNTYGFLTGSDFGLVSSGSYSMRFQRSADSYINNGNDFALGSTASPYRLGVFTSAGANLAQFKDTDSSHDGLIIGGDTNGAFLSNSAGLVDKEAIYLYNALGGLIRFYAGGNEVARMSPTGLMINETSSSVNFKVNGTSQFTGLIYDANASAGSVGQLLERTVSGVEYRNFFGAVSTGGTLDWNDATNTRSGSGYSLMYGSATNGPNGNTNFFHPFNFEYGSQDGTGNVTQFAIPYGLSGSIDQGIYYRGRYSGTWTDWEQIVTTSNIASIAGVGGWTEDIPGNRIYPTSIYVSEIGFDVAGLDYFKQVAAQDVRLYLDNSVAFKFLPNNLDVETADITLDAGYGLRTPTGYAGRVIANSSAALSRSYLMFDGQYNQAVTISLDSAGLTTFEGFYLKMNDADVFTVNSAGDGYFANDLGIGNPNPIYKLDVQGTSGTVAIRALSNTANDILFYGTGTVTGNIKFLETNINASGVVQSIFRNTNVGAGGVVNQLVTAGAGDVYTSYTISGAQDWSIGVDNSASDAFRIGANANPSSANNVMTLLTTGEVGIGVSDPATYFSQLVVGGVADSKITILAGGPTRESNLYFADGTTFAERVAGGFQYQHTNDKLNIYTNNTLQVTIASTGNVGIGTTSPSYDVDITKTRAGSAVTQQIRNLSNNASSDANLLLSIVGTSGGDPRVNFAIGGGENFTLGVDNSDSDKFKISNSSTLASAILTMDPATNYMGVNTTTPDYQLDVVGTFRTSSNAYIGSYLVHNAGSSSLSYNYQGYGGVNKSYWGSLAGFNAGDPDSYTIGVNGINPFSIYTNGIERLFITGLGFIGVKESSPFSLLSNTSSGFTDNYADSNTEGIVWETDNNINYTATFRNSLPNGSALLVQGDTSLSSASRVLTVTSSNAAETVLFMVRGNAFTGVGTSNPTNLLTLNQTYSDDIKLSLNAGAGYGFGTSSSDLDYYSVTNHKFFVNSSNSVPGDLALFINSSKYLGVAGATNLTGEMVFPASTSTGPKLVLYEGLGYGLGVSASDLDYYSATNHKFYTGSTTSSQGTLRAEIEPGGFTIYNNLQLSYGSPSAGDVLTTDALGNISFTSQSSISASNLSNTSLSAIGDYSQDWNSFQLKFSEVGEFQMLTGTGTRNGVLQLDNQAIFYVKNPGNNERSGVQATSERVFYAGAWDLSFKGGLTTSYDGTDPNTLIVTGQSSITDKALLYFKDDTPDHNLYTEYGLQTSAPLDTGYHILNYIGDSIAFIDEFIDIAPASLSATTNNWNPTGFTDARETLIILSLTTNVTLTGLQAKRKGGKVTIVNSSSFNLIVNDQNTGSSSANRFQKLPGNTDFTLNPGESISFIYSDVVAAGWYCTGIAN